LEELVRGLLTEEGSVFCFGLTDKERAVRIPEERRSQDYSFAAITIEEVSGAIAESGTIICSASGGRALQAGMVPEHHVAIVSREKIFPNIEGVLESFTTLPSTLTFITGPSRTADIEKKLVIGVHGPERLTVAVW
jgi:L-lactate dehydrogenase complex protein LldG